MPRGQKPKTYDSSLVEKVRNLYGEGMTQAEIGRELGFSQKVIWNLMRRHGIVARMAVKRDQSGQNNHHWKGSEASYEAKHMRVETLRGRPKKCQQCGNADTDKIYDWANLTGNYDDPADYRRMCRSCHRLFDNERRKGVM